MLGNATEQKKKEIEAEKEQRAKERMQRFSPSAGQNHVEDAPKEKPVGITADSTITHVKKVAYPIYCAAAVWIVSACCFRLYTVPAIIFTAAVSCGVYFLTDVLWKKQAQVTVTRVPFVSGNADLDTVIRTIDEVVTSLKESSDPLLSADPDTAQQMNRISDLIEEIRSSVIEKPERTKQLRRFLNYYLPTTKKLCHEYTARIQETSDQMISTRASIRTALASIEEAFRRQRDALRADDVLDITTDIQVLDQLLVRDNLK